MLSILLWNGNKNGIYNFVQRSELCVLSITFQKWLLNILSNIAVPVSSIAVHFPQSPSLDLANDSIYAKHYSIRRPFDAKFGSPY